MATTTTDLAPNHTIYINNLNEKTKKDGKFMRIAKLADQTKSNILSL